MRFQCDHSMISWHDSEKKQSEKISLAHTQISINNDCN